MFDGAGGALCGFLTFFQLFHSSLEEPKITFFGAFEAYNDISSFGGERDTQNQNRFTQLPSSSPSKRCSRSG
jgi:hypothetical protein